MRVLHLTDTHIGAELPVIGGPAGWSRAADHLAAMETALQPALHQLVDLVVHSGDVFHRSRPGPAAMHAAAQLLTRVARRTPVVLMPGNHDRCGLARSLPLRTPGLHIYDQPAVHRHGDLRLGVVPYCRTPETWAAQAAALDSPFVIAHQAFDGARVPGLTFRVGAQRDTLGPQHLPPRTRWVMCGHIHPRQVTRLAGAQIVQPGSTERTHFSEADQTKGYALWDLGRQVRWRFVDLPARPMCTLRHRAQLTALQPGTLVRSHLPHDELADRGLLVVDRPGARPPRPASRQTRLFA